MTLESAARSWQPRRQLRWSMPISLQPRAAQRLRILRAEDKRPVPVSRLGYHLRPGRHYQLEVATGDSAEAACTVALVGGPARRTSGQDHLLTHEGQLLRRVDFQLAREDDGRSLSSHWWTRLEPLVTRLDYADGRESCEQTSWLLIAPRRLWALWMLVSSALLYGLVPWVCRAVLERGGLPAGWRHVLHLLAQPAVWQGLMLLVVGLWLAIWISDALQLWLRAGRLRSELRREVQHYLLLAAAGDRPPGG